jgi:hypothetical protein
VAIVPLSTFRAELRARLRETWPAGVPVLTDAVVMIADYLRAEQRSGRIAADAQVDGLAPMLIGSAHLLFADRTGVRPDVIAVRKMVATVLGGSVLGGPVPGGPVLGGPVLGGPVLGDAAR